MEYIKIEQSLKKKFPKLDAQIVRINNVRVRKEDAELEKFKDEVIERTRDQWTLDQLREHHIFRAYRDFFWRVGVDPTKIRPAAEALIRRILRERPIPKINTLVDVYNLASIDSAIPIAAFDMDGLVGDLLMRQAEKGEKFLGIGMDKPVTLKGGEAVVEDQEKLIAIYPYRDADACKIALDTNYVLILICGVPNITKDKLAVASRITVEYVTRFCNGSAEA